MTKGLDEKIEYFFRYFGRIQRMGNNDRIGIRVNVGEYMGNYSVGRKR